MSVIRFRKNSVATFSEWYRDGPEDCPATFLQRYSSRNKMCTICCGFYGPNFDQPLCHTCHAFLFPGDINIPDGTVFLQDKSDAEDSGNEEPSDFYDTIVSNQRQERPRIAINSPKLDKLAECITALSIPKKKEMADDDFFAKLPTEVLMKILSYLDDLSLWNCAQVCRKWAVVIRGNTPQEKWRKFVQRRWPLFQPSYTVRSWKAVYNKLPQAWDLIRKTREEQIAQETSRALSTSCFQCLHQMKEQVMRSVPSSDDKKWRAIRLRNEIKVLRTDPPEGIKAMPLDPQCYHWQASITGPVDSPYEGGVFLLYLQIPHSYPMRPPMVTFITKIFHPNVSRHGNIGIDSIQDNWSLALTISKILISIQSLLTDPYCHVCMEPELGKLYQENRAMFDATARVWTYRYAMTHSRHPFTNQLPCFP